MNQSSGVYLLLKISVWSTSMELNRCKFYFEWNLPFLYGIQKLLVSTSICLVCVEVFLWLICFVFIIGQLVIYEVLVMIKKNAVYLSKYVFLGYYVSAYLLFVHHFIFWVNKVVYPAISCRSDRYSRDGWHGLTPGCQNLLFDFFL